MDSYGTSDTFVQNTESSKTLVQDSISRDRGCKPFWNSYSKELSQNLWLPTERDCVGSVSNYSRPYVKNMRSNSWFSTGLWVPKKMNLHKTSLPSLTTLLQRITEKEQLKREKEEEKKREQFQNKLERLENAKQKRLEKKKKDNEKKVEEPKKKKKDNEKKIEEEKDPEPKEMKNVKSRLILLRVRMKQRNILYSWFAAARWTYNRCLHAIKTNECKIDKTELRTRFVTSKDLPDWIRAVPYDIRDEALSDLMKAYKTCWSNKRNGNITHFSLSFKTCLDESESIVVRVKNWSNRYWFKTKLGSRLWGYEKLPEKLLMDSRMVRKGNKYYICNLIPLEINPSPSKNSIVSIDPGMRTFLTCYDPIKEQILELSNGSDPTRIFHSLKHADKLEKKIKSIPNKSKRYRMKKALKRIRQRLINRVKDMHRKCASYLCKNYETILIPKFNVSHIVKRETRKINKKTTRILLKQSHYAFRQFLKHKSKEFPGCNVIEVDESYTSKTCTGCGHINHTLGGDKTFVCNSCRLVIDRDVNGSRNILIRFLSLISKEF